MAGLASLALDMQRRGTDLSDNKEIFDVTTEQSYIPDSGTWTRFDSRLAMQKRSWASAK